MNLKKLKLKYFTWLTVFFFSTVWADDSAIDTERWFYVAEAPKSLIELWEHSHEYFKMQKYVKQHDLRSFSKWRQLKKLWSQEKNESGHYERKESVVITSDLVDKDLSELAKCRKDLLQFSIKHLENIECKHQIPAHSLTMKKEIDPTHTLRLLHYFDDATATAHCDTSILTCLYYRDEGLQLKVGGKWMNAPKLEKNQMLVTYGVPGELLSEGT